MRGFMLAYIWIRFLTFFSQARWLRAADPFILSSAALMSLSLSSHLAAQHENILLLARKLAVLGIGIKMTAELVSILGAGAVVNGEGETAEPWAWRAGARCGRGASPDGIVRRNVRRAGQGYALLAHGGKSCSAGVNGKTAAMAAARVSSAAAWAAWALPRPGMGREVSLSISLRLDSSLAARAAGLPDWGAGMPASTRGRPGAWAQAARSLESLGRHAKSRWPALQAQGARAALTGSRCHCFAWVLPQRPAGPQARPGAAARHSFDFRLFWGSSISFLPQARPAWPGHRHCRPLARLFVLHLREKMENQCRQAHQAKLDAANGHKTKRKA